MSNLTSLPFKKSPHRSINCLYQSPPLLCSALQQVLNSCFFFLFLFFSHCYCLISCGESWLKIGRIPTMWVTQRARSCTDMASCCYPSMCAQLALSTLMNYFFFLIKMISFISLSLRYRCHEMMLKNFPSRYGRKALIATYLVKDSPQLTLGTFHLESYPEEHPARKLQLEMIKSLTR